MKITIDGKMAIGLITALIIFLQAVVGLLESGVAGVPGV